MKNLTTIFQPTLDWLDLEIIDTQRILNRLETARSVLLEATIGEPVDPPLTAKEVEMYNKAMAYQPEDPVFASDEARSRREKAELAKPLFYVGNDTVAEGNGTQTPRTRTRSPSIFDDRAAMRAAIVDLFKVASTPLRANSVIHGVGATRTKRTRQAVYNALSQMKKAGTLVHENGHYRLF